MKVIKTIGKLILVLLIPFIMQFVGFIIAGMYIGFQTAASGGDINNIAQEILGLTPAVVLFASIFTIILFFLVHTSKKRHSMKEAYRFNVLSVNEVLYALGLGLSGFMLSTGFMGLTDIGSLDASTTEMLNNLVVNDNFLLTLLGVGIFVPISEEIVFRGSVIKNLNDHLDMKWVIIIQAFIFSLYHMNIVQAVPTLVLGLGIGLLMYYTNSIWSAIIIHIVNNSSAIILSNVLPSDLIMTKVHYGVMGLIGFSGFMMVLLTARRHKRPYPNLEPLESEDLLEAI